STDQADDLARVDLDIDASERPDVAVIGFDTLDFQKGFTGHHTVPSSSFSAISSTSSSSTPRYAAITFGSFFTWSGVPSEIFWPYSRTTTWSEISMTTDMSCSIRRMETPSSRIECSNALSAEDSRGLRPAAGSSRQ